MTVLTDHQFEILPTETAPDGFVFGIGANVSLDEDGFDPGEAEWLTQNSENTRRGGRNFGRDVLGAKTWVWSSHVNEDDIQAALGTLEQFATAWAPWELMETSGKLTCLRYKVAGRTRRIYGRPRRFAAPPTNLILSGYVPVTHDFELVDSYTYDDVESSTSVSYSTSASGGGFVLPSVMPLVTQPSDGNGIGQVIVGGSARAYPIIRLNGPWTNPVVQVGDWAISWTGSILAGQWVEIDCRPWALTVLNQSGASVVGGLNRSVWLDDCWLAPGDTPQLSLDGIAPSGGASVDMRWRDTWNGW